MKIKIWGCRGSLPSPGRETVRYGGDSTCLEIRNDDGHVIIIDAGSGMRKLGDSLLADPAVSKITLLLTHAHWDHLSGFPFFRPAYFSKYSIDLCGGPVPRQSLMNFLKHQMDPPFFPVDFSILKADFSSGCRCDETDCGNKLPDRMCTFECHSIPLNHPNGGYGFKLVENNRSFVFLTDNEIQYHHESGRTRDEYVDFCRNASLLFHDAHYFESEYEKRRGWGHSTYQDAIELAIDAGVKRLGFFHHDPDRTDEDIDRQLDWCRDYISDKGSQLKCFACADGMELIV